MSDRTFAKIVFAIPIDREFHYKIPEAMAAAVKVGARVRAPFGKSVRNGWCVGLSESAGVAEVKDILDVIDPDPLIDETGLKLARFIADRYLCSWGEALNAAVPAGVKKGTVGRRIKSIEWAVAPESVERIASEKGIVGEKQMKLIKALRDAGGIVIQSELLKAAGATLSSLQTLVKAGIVRVKSVERELGGLEGVHEKLVRPPVLTPDQERAMSVIEESLRASRHEVVLLHGVTGSGKTEVYLRCIEQVVARGRQAIILVPEISLTPQTVGRFKARFARIAVLHSHLGESERARHWKEIGSGNIDVIVGARSAIFAPVKSLGAVVVDEEHETSYKQESTPRYHVREVAIERARLENAIVILGTATPSLESYHNARAGNYRVAELPSRVENLPLPPVEIVDMVRERAETRGYPLISRRLKALMEEAVKNEEQTILFINRRGFTNYIACRRCEWVLRCKLCDVAVTFHKAMNRVFCHHCMESVALPSRCPACDGGELRQFGVGTERIEEEIKALFPEFVVGRMDSDSMKRTEDYQRSIEGLWSGKVDILVGTQMIAKGFDVPNVTLVGVVSADTAFHLPDFRAAERTFQLITQVAGRAGRGPKGGRVVVQTFNPDHYSIRCAVNHDYKTFAEMEMATREKLAYPPFTRLLRIVIQGGSDQNVRTAAEELVGKMRSAIDEKSGKVIGPVMAPLARIRGRLRMQALVKAFDWETVLRNVKPLLTRRFLPGAAQITADADPMSMM